MEYIYLKFSLIEVSVLWEKTAKISGGTDFSSGTTAIGNRSMVLAATYLNRKTLLSLPTTAILASK